MYIVYFCEITELSLNGNAIFKLVSTFLACHLIEFSDGGKEYRVSSILLTVFAHADQRVGR